MSSSNPEAPKVSNILFMGPLAHREQTLEAFQKSKMNARWSEDVENEYLENVKQRATEKVRALLLQAKRRSDEIIREAEEKAEQINAEAKQEADQILEAANLKFSEAENRFQNIFNEAMDKAQEDVKQIITRNQQDLGESTAIVLLSIHEQLTKFYDTWKEDLKQLTIEAIQVGTSWILTTEKKEILRQMLDESVHKLIERKNFTVRVNPEDASLVTQVLENSRNQSWQVEASNDLEPGSLELESDNVFIKNSSYERQKFVHEILENLVLPKTNDDVVLNQEVTDTVMKEMSTNPLLAQSYNTEDDQEVIEEPTQPQEEIQNNAEMALPEVVPQETEPQADMVEENTASFANEEENSTTSLEPVESPINENTNENIEDETEKNMDHDEFLAEQFVKQKNAEYQKPVINAHLGQPVRETPRVPLPEQAHEEAQDMVEEFLGELEDKKNHLPTSVADDLLAEMGFDEKQ